MKKTNKKGFTLVELVIVIAVIAILAAVLIPTFTAVIQRANQSKALQQWKAVMDEEYVDYVADAHTVPTTLYKVGNSFTFVKPTATGTYDKYVLADKGLVVLDEANKVNLIWTDGGYQVVTGELNSENKLTVNTVVYTLIVKGSEVVA